MGTRATPHASGTTVPGAPYRATCFPPLTAQVETRPDGVLILRPTQALPPLEQRAFADFVPLWAASRGDAPAFGERDSDGAWRTLSWAALWSQVQAVGASLLALGLGPQRPLMLLSGNSIEQAVLLLLAAEYVGVPTAPVSPAYALQGHGGGRLREIRTLLPPGALFVQASAPFARALELFQDDAIPVIAVHGAHGGQLDWQQLAGRTLTAADQARVAAAHAAIGLDDIARVLFTSGSTGAPKGVPLRYRNFHAVAAYMQHMFAALVAPQAVFLDWLPWHHGLGGVLNLGRSMVLGGSHYIDDGRPQPGLLDKTVRNLREISPSVFNSVPAAWVALADAMERDPALARSLFARVVNFGYGGASLPADVWRRVDAVAQATIGERIVFCTGLASTETTGLGTFRSWPSEDIGNIGLPVWGVEVKLVPLDGGDGRYEIRMRGDHVFSGYLQRPDLTAAAFDEEGFFLLGDAVRLADPADPGQGLRFAGRVVEDFKLINGTWVRTGAVRLALLAQCAPLLTDAVICGHDQGYVAALAWPDINACRRLAPELATLPVDALVAHPRVVQALQERLGAQRGGGASLRVERLMLMAEPPSMDANEIADKGYVNQVATRARRAHLVEALYRAAPADHVARAG